MALDLLVLATLPKLHAHLRTVGGVGLAEVSRPVSEVDGLVQVRPRAGARRGPPPCPGWLPGPDVGSVMVLSCLAASAGFVK